MTARELTISIFPAQTLPWFCNGFENHHGFQTLLVDLYPLLLENHILFQPLRLNWLFIQKDESKLRTSPYRLNVTEQTVRACVHPSYHEKFKLVSGSLRNFRGAIAG